ncbi:MAG: hypothetical protein K2Q97_02540, partial [Burkholderiaceae bacterium]|nr:hypothetical protein [Burkholderiaceae bacterium]
QGLVALVQALGDLQGGLGGEAKLAIAIDAATRKGWVPRDQYKGDPGKWVDADTFLERGEKFASNLQRENAELRKRIASFEGTQKAFTAYMDGVIKNKDAALTQAIAALRIERSAAIREGDDAGAIELEDKIDQLKEEKVKMAKLPEELESEQEPKETPSTTAGQDPIVEEWIDDGNTWFREDPQLRKYAVQIGQNMIKAGETLKGRRFLDKVADFMRQEFPRRFRKFDEAAAGGTSAGKTAPMNPVENNTARGGPSTPGASGKTERDLPAEDLALMKQFVKEGWTTKEKFLAGYFSR